MKEAHNVWFPWSSTRQVRATSKASSLCQQAYSSLRWPRLEWFFVFFFGVKIETKKRHGVMAGVKKRKPQLLKHQASYGVSPLVIQLQEGVAEEEPQQTAGEATPDFSKSPTEGERCQRLLAEESLRHSLVIAGAAVQMTQTTSWCWLDLLFSFGRCTTELLPNAREQHGLQVDSMMLCSSW